MRALLVAAAVLTVMLVAAAPARAHASFLSATPDPGTGLAQAPGEVVLRFSEPLILGPSEIVVEDEFGQSATDGPTLGVEGDDRAMRRRLDLLSPGVYTVSWTTVSPVDGHTLKGSYRFAVGATTLGEESVRADPLSSEGPLGLVGRWLGLLGLTMWLGAAFLGPVAVRAGASEVLVRRTRVAAPAAAAAGTALSLLATSVVSSGELSVLRDVVMGGRSGALRAGVVAVASIGAGLAGRWPRSARLLAPLAAVLEGASGHAGTSPYPWLTAATFSSHLVAVGVWTFAIAAALSAGRRVRQVLAALSSYAVLASAAVGLTGAGAAALELNTVSELETTGYGRTLLVKTALFLAMALAGLEHRRRARDTVRRRRLVGPLGVEAVAALGALAAAAVLVSFPNPPREDLAAADVNDPATVLQQALADPAVSVAGRSGDYVVGLTVTPPVPGDVELLVQVEGLEPGDGLRDVTLQARSPEGTVIGTRLDDCGIGCFRGSASLQQRGTWSFEVSGVTNDVPLATQVELPLPAEDGSQRFDAMLNAMGSLRTAQVREELRASANGEPIVSEYRFAAPDRMSWLAPNADASERMAFGDYGYRRRSPTQPWERYEWPGDGFAWPDGFYSAFFQGATTHRLLGTEVLDGRSTTILAFVQATYPAWYRVWIDDEDRIRRLEMLTDRHFMDQSYGPFDRPVDISEPTARRASPVASGS